MNDKEIKVGFELLKKYDEDSEYLENFIIYLRDVLYSRTDFVSNSSNDLEREKFYEILKEKVVELYSSNKGEYGYSRMADAIEYVGCGHTSLAFKIGDLVFKVGKQKNPSRIDRLSDIDSLIPILYNNDYKVADGEYYSLQVNPYVAMCGDLGEELYSVYEGIRKKGYIWNDPKEENIGVITKDFSYNGHLYKNGDKVVVDLEDLAWVGEVTDDLIMEELSYMSYNRNTYRFEERYMNELMSKNKSVK